ncbi:chitinase [Schizosaccharomyces cryophilus OY26]|uniref:Chitinase n=1 Tax=Schizosaccharomyces cryophilus (strain OY26 / ATCC MYA-4695 / CBS 11777 / NBRC 106824 / NRRL Y48691) TaxID=653667 RepID=S9XEE1_SCHCR|nr:chitinase [Schizosaccharomyces cryophilus OY26]EPY52146.1 chitinase [Schizosaccharomyces cryophilus OY26]
MQSVYSLLLLAIISQVTWALNFSNHSTVVGYWGSNLSGELGYRDQKPLADYCKSSNYDVVILSSVIDFSVNGWPVYDFSNLCSDSDKFRGTELKQCPQIERDIQVCQQEGVKVLLSIGGYNGDFTIDDEDDGQKFAFQMWNVFGGGQELYRPFGKAVVDGFNLEVNKGTNTAYSAFAKRLLEIYTSDPDRKYYLSAAPTCMVPDKTLTNAVAHNSFDFLSIHTFNASTGVGCNGSRNSTFAAWVEYAEDSAYDTETALLYGIIAQPNAAVDGYMNSSNLISTLQAYKSNSSLFGGVAVWDTSLAEMSYNTSTSYIDIVRNVLKGGSVANSSRLSEFARISPASSSSSSTAKPSTSVSVSYDKVPEISTTTDYETFYTTTTILSTIGDSSFITNTAVSTMTKPASTSKDKSTTISSSTSIPSSTSSTSGPLSSKSSPTYMNPTGSVSSDNSSTSVAKTSNTSLSSSDSISKSNQSSTSIVSTSSTSTSSSSINSSSPPMRNSTSQGVTSASYQSAPGSPLVNSTSATQSTSVSATNHSITSMMATNSSVLAPTTTSTSSSLNATVPSLSSFAHSEAHKGVVTESFDAYNTFTNKVPSPSSSSYTYLSTFASDSDAAFTSQYTMSTYNTDPKIPLDSPSSSTSIPLELASSDMSSSSITPTSTMPSSTWGATPLSSNLNQVPSSVFSESTTTPITDSTFTYGSSDTAGTPPSTSFSSTWSSETPVSSSYNPSTNSWPTVTSSSNSYFPSSSTWSSETPVSSSYNPSTSSWPTVTSSSNSYIPSSSTCSYNPSTSSWPTVTSSSNSYIPSSSTWSSETPVPSSYTPSFTSSSWEQASSSFTDASSAESVSTSSFSSEASTTASSSMSIVTSNSVDPNVNTADKWYLTALSTFSVPDGFAWSNINGFSVLMPSGNAYKKRNMDIKATSSPLPSDTWNTFVTKTSVTI